MFEKLRQLKDGWMKGAGWSPKPSEVDWLESAFRSNYPDALPKPHVRPTPDGDVRLEWTLGSVDVSLEIDMSSRKAVLRQLDIQSGHEVEWKMCLNRTGWNRLAIHIGSLAGQSGGVRQHGGKRPGAGRKTTLPHSVARQFLIDRQADAAIERLSILWECTRSDAVRRAVVEADAKEEKNVTWRSGGQ